jgi:hypothetical protein
MQKPISTTIHGAIDYTTAGMLVGLPRAFGWNQRTTNLLTGSALTMLGYSLMTDYEFSLFKLLPMQAHLALDTMSATNLLAAPMICKEGKMANAMLVGIGLFEMTVTMLTKTQPTARSKITRFMGRRVKPSTLGKASWLIGKQTEPSTIGKAAQLVGILS